MEETIPVATHVRKPMVRITMLSNVVIFILESLNKLGCNPLLHKIYIPNRAYANKKEK